MIRALTVQSVRNIQNIQLQPSEHINVFYGENGAGKTSILEAVHLLAMARSFTQARTKTSVSLDSDQLSIVADIDAGQLSLLKKASGKYRAQFNQQPVKSLSELVSRLPVQLIHSDSFRLLEGSPADRRRFLDWGVFHTEPTFYQGWQTFQKCLKNRNSLLRSGKIERSAIAVWEKGFLESARLIDKARQSYLEKFTPYFHEVLSQLTELDGINVRYQRGWDRNKELGDVIEQQRQRDTKLGYTQAGPQRADLTIRMNSHRAVDVLSRGQQKLVVCALKVAQSMFLQEHTSHKAIFLIDDLPAELDRVHIGKLAQMLERLGCQVFMTAVEAEPLKRIWQNPDQVRMFHVEHGKLESAVTIGDNND